MIVRDGSDSAASPLATMFLLLGASMVPIGLLDHLLFVRLVREARASQSTVVST